jgi:hypothetical protein
MNRRSRVSLLASAIALLSCGGGAETLGKLHGPPLSKATGGPGIITIGEVPENVKALTAEIWQLASQARRLTPKEPVKLAVLAPNDLVGVVKKHVAAEVPPEVIRGEGRCYAALGLVPYDYDYEAETYLMLEDELAGLYIPEDKTMYVAKGLAGADLEATLSHELVHALQDQYFSVGKKMKYEPGASDALGAMQALAEGDATSAMIDELVLADGGAEALAHKSAVDIADKDAEDLSKDDGKKKLAHKTPRFLALGLVAPYADGMRFVNGLRRRGGWKAVDAAWAKPPTTSEQILHLEKYDLAEPAVVVGSSTAVALGPGWKMTFDDVFGEAEGRLALAEWLDLASSKRAAKGWGGDRVTLFEEGEKRAVAWRIFFDDDKEAIEAFTLLSVGWGTTFGTPASTSAEGADLQIYGTLPSAPSPTKEAPKPTPGKKPAPAASALPPLPPLPDAPGVKPAKPPPPPGCRALRRMGKEVDLLAGAPCTSITAWSKEVGKGTP